MQRPWGWSSRSEGQRGRRGGAELLCRAGRCGLQKNSGFGPCWGNPGELRAERGGPDSVLMAPSAALQEQLVR